MLPPTPWGLAAGGSGAARGSLVAWTRCAQRALARPALPTRSRRRPAVAGRHLPGAPPVVRSPAFDRCEPNSGAPRDPMDHGRCASIPHPGHGPDWRASMPHAADRRSSQSGSGADPCPRMDRRRTTPKPRPPRRHPPCHQPADGRTGARVLRSSPPHPRAAGAPLPGLTRDDLTDDAGNTCPLGILSPCPRP